VGDDPVHRPINARIVKEPLAKRLRLLASVMSVLVVAALLVLAWFFWRVRASRPLLDGASKVEGLTANATIERDALGVPTIRAQTRSDAARALGWVHAQDRFFQMDLLRRSAAGELAELFGKRALPRDRATRMHGFRRLATEVVTRLPPNQRAILESYVVGVNAGLAALSERPFEYLVLRSQPQPWRIEDCVLVVYAMTLDLQDSTGRYERTLQTLRDRLGADALAFFNPLVGPNDAALDGTTAALPPIPGAKLIDLRQQKSVRRASGHVAGDRFADNFPFAPTDRDGLPGSNCIALAGSRTASGAAMVGDDMHLNLGVPNTWYRAVLEWNDGQGTANGAAGQGVSGSAAHRLVGVTLPGTPAIVTGTNGHVAWGFTNSYVDTGDLVVVEANAAMQSLYLAPGADGPLRVETRTEKIRVHGDVTMVADYPWTIWGPIVGHDDAGRPLAFHWTEHDPAATNYALLDMETATTTAEAVAVAHRMGIPPQNMLIADSAGTIAWTIAGRLPKRIGFDGRLPVSWAYGDRHWDGFLPENEVPTVMQPASGDGPAVSVPGQLWSANQRMMGGSTLAKLGDGGYARAARAAQLRDDLAGLNQATPRDLLAVQLDIQAKFLAPWHELLMQTLTPQVTGEKKARGALRSFAEHWEGRASVDAVSYRIVREFRAAVRERIYPAMFASCTEAFPGFNWATLQLEPATWAMLRAKPLNLLNPDYASWDALLVAAVDDVIAMFDREGVTLPQANWGWRNTARIRHPFGNLVPAWLSGWLNMPADPLPGDVDMPRVQGPSFGASERFVVAPGHEADGIFHMPGGESAHPLSPYYRAGHEAWVRGDPTPLLPGKPEHVVRLTP
jgi:penicillin G amidase